MVTCSDWVARTLAAYDDELCPKCGRVHPASYVDQDGNVWGYCWWYSELYILGREYWPSEFDPEPPGSEDLPF